MSDSTEFEVVSLTDRAIVWPRDEYATYCKYRDTRDIEVVRPCFKPGSTPTIYVMRELSNAHRKAIKGDFDDKSRAAFQYGLVRILNWRSKDGPVATFEPDHYDSGVVKDEVIAGTTFKDALMLEIGSVALQLGFFPEGIEQTFQLPPTLLELWAQMVLLHVEQTPSAPDSSSEKTA